MILNSFCFCRRPDHAQTLLGSWTGADVSHQGGLQGAVDGVQLALCSVVQSFHQTLLGLFPVSHLRLRQGDVVENLRDIGQNLVTSESFMQTTELLFKREVTKTPVITSQAFSLYLRPRAP